MEQLTEEKVHFRYSSGNWQGVPLTDTALVVSLIVAATTSAGLTVTCVPDESGYEQTQKSAVKISVKLILPILIFMVNGIILYPLTRKLYLYTLPYTNRQKTSGPNRRSLCAVVAAA